MAGLDPEVLVQEVLVIDDDEVSRELMTLFLGEAGYEGVTANSGDEALAMLRERSCTMYAVLTDMQMGGTTGNALARELRSICGAGTRLIAMSGSLVKAEKTRDFDGFLLKPITVEALRTALAGGEVAIDENDASDEGALNEATYANLAKSMPLGQLMDLYGMCLDDAELRIGLMREAVAAKDAVAYERAAHAIKGGCGMVGATELAKLASEMERKGLKAGGEVEPPEQFLVASARLRRILIARVV